MDRRTFPRISAARPLALRLRVLGNGFRSEELQAEGVTINVSHGGLLARLDQRVGVGTTCSLVVDRADGLMEPARLTARVVHAGDGPAGWEVGFRFEAPLSYLAVPQSLQGPYRDSSDSRA